MDWGGVISGGVGAASAIIGQSMANSANAKQASKNRDFQERMSDTAHQREVLDLKAAGLNPILSSTHGGASTPSGSVSAPQQSIFEKAASSATEIVRNLAESNKLQAQAITESKMPAKIEADTTSAMSTAKLNDELFQNQSVIRQKLTAERQLTEIEADKLSQELAKIPLEIKKLELGNKGIELSNALLKLDKAAAVETLKGIQNEGKIDEGTFGQAWRYVDRFFKPISGALPKYHFGSRSR